MKFIYLVPFLFCSLSACAQQVNIIKKRQFEGNKDFPKKNVILEKIYFEKGKTVAKVEYATNGWQITDSLFFEQAKKTIVLSLIGLHMM